MKPADYDTFAPFFDQVIQDYHNGSADSRHESSWDLSNVGDGGVLDVSLLGLSELSMRVRVGRNLKAFNLPGLMDQAERIKFEQTMEGAFKALIDTEKYQELVDAHVMFKDMDADPYLKSA